MAQQRPFGEENLALPQLMDVTATEVEINTSAGTLAAPPIRFVDPDTGDTYGITFDDSYIDGSVFTVNGEDIARWTLKGFSSHSMSLEFGNSVTPNPNSGVLYTTAASPSALFYQSSTMSAPVDLLAAGGAVVLTSADNTVDISGTDLSVDTTQLQHNDLSGLATGNPHTQYALLAGAAFTGDVNIRGATHSNAGITTTNPYSITALGLNVSSSTSAAGFGSTGSDTSLYSLAGTASVTGTEARIGTSGLESDLVLNISSATLSAPTITLATPLAGGGNINLQTRTAGGAVNISSAGEVNISTTGSNAFTVNSFNGGIGLNAGLANLSIDGASAYALSADVATTTITNAYSLAADTMSFSGTSLLLENGTNQILMDANGINIGAAVAPWKLQTDRPSQNSLLQVNTDGTSVWLDVSTISTGSGDSLYSANGTIGSARMVTLDGDLTFNSSVVRDFTISNDVTAKLNVIGGAAELNILSASSSLVLSSTTALAANAANGLHADNDSITIADFTGNRMSSISLNGFYVGNTSMGATYTDSTAKVPDDWHISREDNSTRLLTVDYTGNRLLLGPSGQDIELPQSRPVIPSTLTYSRDGTVEYIPTAISYIAEVYWSEDLSTWSDNGESNYSNSSFFDTDIDGIAIYIGMPIFIVSGMENVYNGAFVVKTFNSGTSITVQRVKTITDGTTVYIRAGTEAGKTYRMITSSPQPLTTWDPITHAMNVEEVTNGNGEPATTVAGDAAAYAVDYVYADDISSWSNDGMVYTTGTFPRSTIDGATVNQDDRVLVNSGVASQHNGVFVISSWDNASNMTLTRVNNVVSGSLVSVNVGSTLGGKVYQLASSSSIGNFHNGTSDYLITEVGGSSGGSGSGSTVGSLAVDLYFETDLSTWSNNGNGEFESMGDGEIVDGVTTDIGTTFLINSGVNSTLSGIYEITDMMPAMSTIIQRRSEGLYVPGAVVGVSKGTTYSGKAFTITSNRDVSAFTYATDWTNPVLLGEEASVPELGTFAVDLYVIEDLSGWWFDGVDSYFNNSFTITTYDGVALAVGMRLAVESSVGQNNLNGIYTITTFNPGSTIIITRTKERYRPGCLVSVAEDGPTNGNKLFRINGGGSAADFTNGTQSIEFVEVTTGGSGGSLIAGTDTTGNALVMYNAGREAQTYVNAAIPVPQSAGPPIGTGFTNGSIYWDTNDEKMMYQLMSEIWVPFYEPSDSEPAWIRATVVLPAMSTSPVWIFTGFLESGETVNLEITVIAKVRGQDLSCTRKFMGVVSNDYDTIGGTISGAIAVGNTPTMLASASIALTTTVPTTPENPSGTVSGPEYAIEFTTTYLDNNDLDLTFFVRDLVSDVFV